MNEPGGRVGILISGRGSNMIALVDAMQQGRIPATPAVVISNVAEAPGLEAARGRGVPVEVVPHRGVRPRALHEQRLSEVLRRHRVELVCLAGYMRLLGPAFVEAWAGRVLNIHPSLLPAFPGLEAQRQALEHGVKVTGCTVHFVDEQCDHGPIVAQEAVEVLDGDTPESLAARVLDAEHRVYPEAVRLFFEDRLRLEGRRVRVVPPAVPRGG